VITEYADEDDSWIWIIIINLMALKVDFDQETNLISSKYDSYLFAKILEL